MMAVDVFMARGNIFSREGPEWGGVKRRRRSFETLSLEDAAILYAPGAADEGDLPPPAYVCGLKAKRVKSGVPRAPSRPSRARGGEAADAETADQRRSAARTKKIERRMKMTSFEKRLAKAEAIFAAQQEKEGAQEKEKVDEMFRLRLILYLHKKLEAKEEENASLRRDIKDLVSLVEKYYDLYTRK